MAFKGKGQLDIKQFGSRIRQAREQLGISQRELAKMLSKSQADISAYENGSRKIFAIDLPELARALNVSLLYFFEGEINPDDLDRAILEEFHRLPTPKAKQAIIQIVNLLSEVVD